MQLAYFQSETDFVSLPVASPSEEFEDFLP